MGYFEAKMFFRYGSAWTWRWRWFTELNGGMWKPNLTVSISTCSRVVKEGLDLRSESGTSSLSNTTCPISSMDLTVTSCERRVEVIGDAGCLPRFTSEFRRDLILSTCHIVLWAWKGLFESMTIHTPMCCLGITRKWCLLAGFRSLKAMNESSWGNQSH